MGSLSPCYPEPYTWASPTVPSNPRGWYRVLYALADLLGHPRVYPAAIAQCAGYSIRQDFWCPMEAHQILTSSYVGFTPTAYGPAFPTDTLDAVIAANHAVPGFTGLFYKLLITMRFVPSSPQPHHVLLSYINGRNITIDLRTNEQWALGTSPGHDRPMLEWCLIYADHRIDAGLPGIP